MTVNKWTADENRVLRCYFSSIFVRFLVISVVFLLILYLPRVLLIIALLTYSLAPLTIHQLHHPAKIPMRRQHHSDNRSEVLMLE